MRGSSSSTEFQAFDADGYATHTLVLFKGWNEIEICDDGQLMTNPADYQLRICKSFGILTSGGIPPVIGIWDITDNNGNVLKWGCLELLQRDRRDECHDRGAVSRSCSPDPVREPLERKRGAFLFPGNTDRYQRRGAVQHHDRNL